MNGQKRKRVSKERHSWTKNDHIEIFNFIKKEFLNGVEFEKPTAPDYYKKFILETSNQTLKKLPVDKFVQHMKQLRSLYKSAKEWRSRKEEGPLEDNSEENQSTVEHLLLEKCPYFYEFDEVLGENAQVVPPFVLETSIPIPNVVTSKSTRRIRRSPIKTASHNLSSAVRLQAEVEEKRFAWEFNFKMEELSEKRSQFEATLAFEKAKWEDEMKLRRENQQNEFELKRLEIERKYSLEEYKIKMQQ